MIALDDKGITYCGSRIYALESLLKKLHFDERGEGYRGKMRTVGGLDRAPRSFNLAPGIMLHFQTTTWVQDYGRVIEHGALCGRTNARIRRGYLADIHRAFKLYQHTDMFKYLNFIVSKLCDSKEYQVITDFPKTTKNGFSIFEEVNLKAYWNKFSYEFTDVDIQEIIEMLSKFEFDKDKPCLFITTINPKFCEVVCNVIKEIHSIDTFPICLLGLKRR